MDSTQNHKRPKSLDEICVNCGFTQGSHLGTSYYSDFYHKSFPTGYCPRHEGRMDWNDGPGTVFKGSGEYKNANT